jgi:hypothetical protein
MRAADYARDVMEKEPKWARLISIGGSQPVGTHLFSGEVTTANSHYAVRPLIALGQFSTNNNVFQGIVMVFPSGGANDGKISDSDRQQQQKEEEEELWFFLLFPDELKKKANGGFWARTVTSVFYRPQDVSCKFIVHT